ncbi:MAG TPA: hypothetical protein VGU66_09515 [Candidatus Elarobacter sp.]|nr:hypothetical protein [Candidatus Elarobacter sp.]
MIEAEIIDECVRLADSVPERYREPAFAVLLRHALLHNGTVREDPSLKPAKHPGSRDGESLELDALAQILVTADAYDRRILAAVRILELERGGEALLSDLPAIFKRYRVKPPGNISRDVSKLIRRGVLLEHGRDGRRVRIALSNQGLSELQGSN